MKMVAQKRALDKIYKRRDRYEIPDWQREEVWSNAKKQKLIDTILRGWKLPKFYFLKTSTAPEEFEVLDGQQRLAAIWDFMNGDLVLSETTAKEFGGTSHTDLPDEVSDFFDDYEIEYDEITEASEEEQKEFFQRLQEGLPLTGSEKLNAVHSKLRDFCKQVAKHPFFAENCDLSNKRYAYFDISSKVVALEIEGLGSGTRFEDIREVFNQNSSFNTNSAVAKRVKRSLDLLSLNVQKPSKRLRNRTVIQTVVNFICHLIASDINQDKIPLIAKFIDEFLSNLSEQIELGQSATDHDLISFQSTINANVRSGAKTRNNVLLKKLFREHPDLFSSHLNNNSLSALLSDHIASSEKDISELISKINDAYSSKHGGNLFKPTNKTIKTLSVDLRHIIKDSSEYKSLITSLYFVFREGVGERLGQIIPPTFSDINDLRTQLEHDVEHGKEPKIKKKKKSLGATFEKYSGGTSYDTLGSDGFLIMQANIYAGLVDDLRRMLREYSV